MNLRRRVEPEWLDSLSPEDPRAKRSRRDLRRVNRVMMAQWLVGAPLDALVRAPATASSYATLPVNITELGAGDGALLLRLGQHYAMHWPPIDLTLVDRQPVVAAQTLEGYRALGWHVRVVRDDVHAWLAQPEVHAKPVLFANLFVHHFDGERLRLLLDGVARHARAFLCCEPRRSRFCLASSRMLGAIGCSTVTRHDAMVSVQAGFAGAELSTLWPHHDVWSLREGSAGMFSHLFCAARKPEI